MRLVDTWAIVRHSTDRPVKGGQMGVATTDFVRDPKKVRGSDPGGQEEWLSIKNSWTWDVEWSDISQPAPPSLPHPPTRRHYYNTAFEC